MAASQKHSHLLQLADQGPALRAALAEEVAELLTAWPSDYPDSMRCVCEALLAKATRDVDRQLVHMSVAADQHDNGERVFVGPCAHPSENFA